MCHVSNFLCGCADLRRGALIIGITKLVSLAQFFQLRIQLQLNSALLSTVRVSVRHRPDISHFSHI